MVVEKLYSDIGEELFIRIPKSLVNKLSIKENDAIIVERSESCYDDGEYEGIIITFKDKRI
ncbi:hypothetical protein H8D85_02450 [bacterium]|nr:hypothetical protein [bacterium]